MWKWSAALVWPPEYLLVFCTLFSDFSIAMLWRKDNSCVLMEVVHLAFPSGTNISCSPYVGLSCHNQTLYSKTKVNGPANRRKPQSHPLQSASASAGLPDVLHTEAAKDLLKATSPDVNASNMHAAALAVVVPTYNEADNLEELVETLFALPLKNLRLVVVDDDSPDGTGALADKLAQRYNQVHTRISVIHRPQKGGLGTAYVAGFQRALSEGAEFIVQMDADFSHSPSYILQMLGVIFATGMDVVIGSRYVPGGSLDENWNWWRSLLSKWANIYCRTVLKVRVRDMTAGFKLWQRSALQDINLHTVRSNGYIFQVEMAYLSEKLGFHIIELPIHFEDRRVGQSKMNVPVKVESVWRVWELLWRHRKRVSGAREPLTQPPTVMRSGRPAPHR